MKATRLLFPCAALAMAAPLSGFAAAPELKETDNSASIVWQGSTIAELQGYRRLRFRSSGDNERWLGTRISRMDLCWDYGGINDYQFRTRRFEATEQRFVLEIDAEKPSVHGRVTTRLEGKLVDPTTGFAFTLSSKLTASQPEWRAKTRRAPGDRGPLPLEFLDFHVNRISQADLFTPGATPGMEEIYDGFLMSDDGQSWRMIPKIPLSGTSRIGRGHLPTELWEGRGEVGQQLALVDRREGGWKIRLTDATSRMQYLMCWMYYDVHHLLDAGVPEWQPGKDTFEARYGLAFTPLAPAEARQLLGVAQPIEWRSLPEYQLPVFTRYNTFDRLISGNSEYPWLATDARCSVDSTVGFDDRSSVRIQNTDPAHKSAWFAWTWGPTYDSHAPLTGTYRFSAMVKTQGCDAPVRLAVVEFLHDLWPNPDGTLASPKNRMWMALTDRRDRWHYSEQAVSGTSDWARLTLDLKIDNAQFAPNKPESPKRGVVLQYHGKGTVWFDNVRIERIE